MMATPAAPQQQRGRPALSPSWADALRGWAATRDTGVLDALAVGVCLAGVARNRALLSAGDAASLLAFAAVSAATVLWRRSQHHSWAAWRAWPAAALRIAAAASPAAWVITQQSLAAAPPYADSCWPVNALIYSLTLLFCSFAATGSVLALARPLPLRMHMPAQAAALAFIWRQAPAVCATASLTHPAAQRATAAVHRFLSILAATLVPDRLPLPTGHGPVSLCTAVLTLSIVLAFLVPTLVLGAAEAAFHQRYAASWRAWQQEQEEAVQAAEGQPAKLPAAVGEGAGSSTAGGAGPSGSATVGGAPISAPCTQPAHTPAGWVCRKSYELALACLQLVTGGEPADMAVAAAAGTMLLASAWRAVLLLTAAGQ